MTDMTQAPTPGSLSAHPCYDEHQPGCDCVIPEQTAAPMPSYLDRLAPTAPVEASGSERKVSDDLLIRGLTLMADHFKIENPLQREFNVRGWPNMPATTSEAFSECAKVAAERLSALRPQPSGETREAVRLKVANAMLEYAPLDRSETFSERTKHLGLISNEVTDEILALIRPAPVASGGQHSSGEALDAVDPLRRSISDLKRHIEAVQVAKREGGSGSTITDCINALPVIVRALEASEFEIEAAFEAYEDTAPPAPVAETAGEGVELTFGMGALVVNTGTFGGDNAVFIAKATAPGEVGAYTGNAAFKRDVLQPGEHVLIFPTAQQAQAVADALVGAVPAQDDDKLRTAAIVAKNMADNASFNLNQAGLTPETATCDRAFVDIYRALEGALKSSAAQGRGE